MARLVVPELHDEFGEVGLDRADAGSFEGLVQTDLLGRHRLDLHDLGRARCLHEVDDDPVRLVGIARPVHDAAARNDRRLELF